AEPARCAVRGRHVVAGLPARRPCLRRVHAGQHPSAAGQRRIPVGRTVLRGVVSGVHLARERGPGDSSCRLDRRLRGSPGLHGCPLLHVAANFLKALSRHPLAGALALLTVSTVVMTWPQALHLSTRIPEHTDPLLSIWRLAWIAHAVPNDLGHLFDANIFFPHLRTLAPYRIEHFSHLELQWTVWMPLTLWAVHRTFDEGTRRSGVLAGLFLWL